MKRKLREAPSWSEVVADGVLGVRGQESHKGVG